MTTPSTAAAALKMEKADLPDWKLAYRLDEAAAATGIGRSTLYRRARQGKLKMKRDGGNTVILREELKRFLSELPDAEIRQGESH